MQSNFLVFQFSFVSRLERENFTVRILFYLSLHLLVFTYVLTKLLLRLSTTIAQFQESTFDS